MSKNILITGGLGFIGFEITRKLLSLGHRVKVLDNLSVQIHSVEDSGNKLTELRQYPGFEFLHADIRDEAALRSALSQQQVIIHLAAETGTGQSMYEIANYVDVNVRGTAILLDLIGKEKHRPERIILSSSRSIYGEGKYHCATHGTVYPTGRFPTHMENGMFEPVCPRCNRSLQLVATDEDSLINPLSVYATTKRQQEELIGYAKSTLQVPYTIFRYQNVYGAGQSLKNPYTGILSIFFSRIKNGKPIEIFEDGKESRDFVYVDDVVNATISPVLQPSERTEILNVGTGEQVSVLRVVDEIMKILGRTTAVSISGKYRVGDIRHNKAAIERITDTYGFRPTVDFSTGLRRFIEWASSQPDPSDGYEKSLAELKEKGLYK